MLSKWINRFLLLSDDKIGALIAKVATGWLFLSVCGAGISLFGQAYLARLLGVNEYGWYVLYLAWIQILVIPAVFGIDTAVLKFSSIYVATKEWAQLRGALLFGFVTALLLSLLVILCVFGAKFFLNIGWPSDRQGAFEMALLLIPILAVSKIAEQVLRGFKRVLISVFAEQVFRPAFLLAVIFVLSTTTAGINNVTGAMIINIAGASLAVFGMLAVAALRVPKDVYSVSAQFHTREWMSVAVPMVFMSTIYILLAKVDVVMLGQIVGAAEAGIYSAAARLSGLVAFGLGAVNSISAPMLAEYYRKGNTDSLERTLSWSAKIATVIAALATLFLLVFGEWVLEQFGQEFIVGYSALLILLIGACAQALTGSVGYMLVMAGRQSQAAFIIGGGLVINVALNIILIPRYGIVGAAIATCTSTTFSNSFMYIYVKKSLGINPSILQLPKRAK